MREINTEIVIDAPPPRVWEILNDFEAYAQWNPFIRSIIGGLFVGHRLEVRIHPPGGKPMGFKPMVLAADPPREFRWRGSLGVRGLFAGEHSFVLEEIADSRTRFVHSERFSGLLVPMVMRGVTLERTRNGFVAMNEALRKRAEAGDSG